ASIDRDMTQGTLVHSGRALDMAIEGTGYFVLNDGEKDVFTRVGSFDVDSQYYLVDPGTGYRVQRTGTEGVTEGFQSGASGAIRIPYDMALPAQATETVRFGGNLSANVTQATTNLLTSGTAYTADSQTAGADTLLADLDQVVGLVAGDTIAITGKDADGTDVTGTFTYGSGAGQDGLTLGDLVQKVTDTFTGATASLVSGQVRLTDTAAGYSQTDLYLTYGGAGTFDLPSYFRHVTAGGQEVKSTNIEVFDSQGVGRTLSAAFVRTDAPNTWDLVVTGLGDDVWFNSPDGRRISGITFNNDGTLAGMGGAVPDDQSIAVRFGTPTADVTTLQTNFGTVGESDGLIQFGGPSTAEAAGQDGYEAGYLSSLSVSRDGVLVGMFTNGVRRDVAALEIATFQNPAGLASLGGAYFTPSGNSGDPVLSQALTGGAGAVSGGTLERSNVDTAQEFVNLIQAQNGFQANARTIRVTNAMLQELSNLIR
ncbi:MAG: flagellar hook-basal body complex protein, partial [Planctomycetes bacterium]|nr:flagellar hook-basal body complex protein [Planctomycetota bacterium]